MPGLAESWEISDRPEGMITSLALSTVWAIGRSTSSEIQRSAINASSFGARKLSKGFIKKDHTHEADMDMEIVFGGFDFIVTQHFFDFKD